MKSAQTAVIDPGFSGIGEPSAEYRLGCRQMREWHALFAEKRLDLRLAELRRKRIMAEYRDICAVRANERTVYQKRRHKILKRILWEIGP